MVAWQPTANVQNVTAQFNSRFPHRDKTSDGTIGNEAHKLHPSGHNPDDTPGSKPAWDGDPDNVPEVRDKDIDSDLGEPGTTMQMVVDHLRRLPNLSNVCRYLIFNHRMYHSRDNFEPTIYTGESPHEEHLHYEGQWSQAADNNSTFDFHLEKVGNPVEWSDTFTANESWTSRFPGEPANYGVAVRQSAMMAKDAARSAAANTTAIVALTNVVMALDDVDEVALGNVVATALQGGLAVDITAALLAAGVELTPEAIKEATEEAVRNVLGGLDNVSTE